MPGGEGAGRGGGGGGAGARRCVPGSPKRVGGPTGVLDRATRAAPARRTVHGRRRGCGRHLRAQVRQLVVQAQPAHVRARDDEAQHRRHRARAPAAAARAACGGARRCVGARSARRSQPACCAVRGRCSHAAARTHLSGSGAAPQAAAAACCNARRTRGASRAGAGAAVKLATRLGWWFATSSAQWRGAWRVMGAASAAEPGGWRQSGKSAPARAVNRPRGTRAPPIGPCLP